MSRRSDALKESLRRCACLEHRLASVNMERWVLRLRLLLASKKIETLERQLALRPSATAPQSPNEPSPAEFPDSGF